MPAMFTVDRASASVKSFDKPGTYAVQIVKAEPAITPKGDAIVTLVMRSDDACVVSDTFYNKEAAWWRLNQILAACPKVQIDDGTQLDLSKREAFNGFLEQFVGQRLQVRLEEEKYVKDGEQKSVLRVKRYSAAAGAADEEF